MHRYIQDVREHVQLGAHVDQITVVFSHQRKCVASFISKKTASCIWGESIYKHCDIQCIIITF